MWVCRKCEKPVYFAERLQSIGFDWHRGCLKCEKCGRVLSPGSHAEHNNQPYCHVPCYAVLFGPSLYGHGTRVETHATFEKVDLQLATDMDGEQLNLRVKQYNQYCSDTRKLSARVRGGGLVVEGTLPIYWGVSSIIHLKQDDDRRIAAASAVRRRSKSFHSKADFYSSEEDSDAELSRKKLLVDPSSEASNLSLPVPVSDNCNRIICDESRSESLEPTTPNGAEMHSNCSILDATDTNAATPTGKMRRSFTEVDGRLRDKKKLTSSRMKNRQKLRRKCSINGHYYNSETSVFTPPHGSGASIFVSSAQQAHEVISVLMDKFRVENPPENYALYVVKDAGETRRVLDHEVPLLLRLLLGPDEDVAKIFIMERKDACEISSDAALYLNLQDPELRAILTKFTEEENREIVKIKMKFFEKRRLITQRLREYELQQLRT